MQDITILNNNILEFPGKFQTGSDKTNFSTKQASNFTGTVMQIKKTLINDRLRVSKVS